MFLFNKETIERTGNTDGIYIIYDDNHKPIFAAKSKNISTDLLSHFNRESAESECIHEHNPTYFQGGFFHGSDKIEDIIKKIKPRCNI